MQRYLEQLLSDITIAIDDKKNSTKGRVFDLHDWKSEEEEDRTAPVRNLQELTSIYQEMLPPAEMLSDEQVHILLNALNQLLDTYNSCFVLQIEVPERIQYATIRDNFNQDIKVKTWHMGFFELCRKGTELEVCNADRKSAATFGRQHWATG